MAKPAGINIAPANIKAKGIMRGSRIKPSSKRAPTINAGISRSTMRIGIKSHKNLSKITFSPLLLSGTLSRLPQQPGSA
jgi:hypothetical protein